MAGEFGRETVQEWQVVQIEWYRTWVLQIALQKFDLQLFFDAKRFQESKETKHQHI